VGAELPGLAHGLEDRLGSCDQLPFGDEPGDLGLIEEGT